MLILRSIAVCLLITFSITKSTAMNWEGHEDWLLSQSHGLILQSELPKAPLAPIPDCKTRLLMSKSNAYEQIPLPGENCSVWDVEKLSEKDR